MSINRLNTINRLGIQFQTRSTPGSSIPSLIIKDGLDWYRKLIRNESYVIDYSPNGGFTWDLNIVVIDPDEDSIIMAIDDGVTGYRDLIRDRAYCIDHELTPTGFDGIKDTDWECVYSTKVL